MPEPELWRLIGTAVAALYGSLLGSFTNVVILRMAAGRSVVFPPSSCPHCGYRLTVADLVPVFSWLWLRGRCRRCRGPISVQYPLVEAAVAAIVARAFWMHGDLRLVPFAAWGVIWLVVTVSFWRADSLAPGIFLWPLPYRLLLERWQAGSGEPRWWLALAVTAVAAALIAGSRRPSLAVGGLVATALSGQAAWGHVALLPPLCGALFLRHALAAGAATPPAPEPAGVSDTALAAAVTACPWPLAARAPLVAWSLLALAGGWWQGRW